MSEVATRGLFVPADPNEPVRRVTVRGTADIALLLGGGLETARYDLDALMLVHGDGRTDGLPLNVRVTRYIKTESAAARDRRVLPTDSGFPDDYGLYGPVVIIGRDLGYDVPDRLAAWFEAAAGGSA
jgi:hypothetical protein